MSTSNLFIPRRINVGFQSRTGTYTGKLAYIIYFDEKGKLRKETSWESWRDKDIPNVEYDNEPLEGFVLNKKVGGYCNDWSNFRQAYVRVYDPRGFEFEITVPNLLYILENTNCIKGKGLEGSFVYGWDGTDLVLVPSSSPDYEHLTKLNDTRFESKRICAKDLKIGATYLTKSGEQIVYLGKFDYYENMFHFDGKFFETYGQMEKYADKSGKELYKKKCEWWDRNKYKCYDYDVGTCTQRYFFSKLSDMSIVAIKSVPTVLIDVVSENCISDFAQRFEKLENNTMYSPYDESKDVKVYYDLETLGQRVKDSKWGVGVNAEWNSKDVRFEIRQVDDGKVVCSKTYYNGEFEPCDLFQCDNRYSYKKMLPVDLKEVFDKFKFFYTEQYLANGNYHGRAW